MTKHAPEPWKLNRTSVDAGSIGVRLSLPPGGQSAEASDKRQEALEATARLIAKDPAVLPTLETAYRILVRDGIWPLRGSAFTDEKVDQIIDLINETKADDSLSRRRLLVQA